MHPLQNVPRAIERIEDECSTRLELADGPAHQIYLAYFGILLLRAPVPALDARDEGQARALGEATPLLHKQNGVALDYGGLSTSIHYLYSF